MLRATRISARAAAQGANDQRSRAEMRALLLTRRFAKAKVVSLMDLKEPPSFVQWHRERAASCCTRRRLSMGDTDE